MDEPPTRTREPSPPSRASRGLLVVLVVSGLLKIGLALAFADLAPRYDETEFLAFGRAIQEEGAAPRLWRAPGQQWLVAAGLALAGGNPVGVRLLQTLLSIAATFCVWRIAQRVAGPRVALGAAAFVAFYPSHVAFSHVLWSETLYGCLTVFAFERLLAADGDRRVRTALGAGVLLGAAALTRSTGVALLVVSALWVARRAVPGRASLAAAMLAGAAIVVIPWSIRATSLAGRPVLVDVNSGFNVWSGNNEYIPSDVQGIWAVGLPLDNGLEPRFLMFYPNDEWRRTLPARMRSEGVTDSEGPDGDDWYRREALREIGRNPVAALTRVPKKLAALWSPDFFLPRHLARDWYGPVPASLALFLVALTFLTSTVPLLAGPVALAARRLGPFRSLAALWLLTYLVVHALAYGHTRMHQPLVPILVVAAFTLTRDVGTRWRRGALPAALVLTAWISAWPIVGGLYISPGPRHPMLARALSVGRESPLTGSERQLWMLAGVEASRGRVEEADRLLAESRHADLPWTLYVRALVARDPATADELLRRALAADPELGAARELRRRIAGASRQP